MNTIRYACPHCHGMISIPRAIVVRCTDCGARPGDPCMDLRSTVSDPRPVSTFHPARHALVREGDMRRPASAPHQLSVVATG